MIYKPYSAYSAYMPYMGGLFVAGVDFAAEAFGSGEGLLAGFVIGEVALLGDYDDCAGTGTVGIAEYFFVGKVDKDPVFHLPVVLTGHGGEEAGGGHCVGDNGFYRFFGQSADGVFGHNCRGVID